jgi:hypothetical protein
MDIDQWAATADVDPRAEGESWEEHDARIAALRKLSAENDVAHPWAHHRRQPEPCPDCRGRKTITERAWGPSGMMTSEFTCLGCNGTGVKLPF